LRGDAANVETLAANGPIEIGATKGSKDVPKLAACNLRRNRGMLVSAAR
jgi:hypothetical protein